MSRPTPAGRPRRRRADPARRVAYTALLAVETQGAYANLALADQLGATHLVGRDAAFATELVDGTARGTGTWDAIIAAASGREVTAFQPGLRVVLRMACHQILTMRVPTRAAVATSVELAGHVIGERVTGLVNAVSRKIALHDLDGWADELAEDRTDRLALRTLHPRWIVEALVDRLGPLEVEPALAADNVPAVPTLVVRPGLATLDELVDAGATPCRYSGHGATRPGNPAEVAAVAEGRAGVQDEGSQLVATALADSCAVDGPWLDLCAGPGGKSALLASIAAQEGRRFRAGEIHPHRADLVRRALEPVPGDHEVVVADGTNPPWPASTFAAVMADVPCSGLGSLRRRPESRWRRQPSDLADLTVLQRTLLASAVDLALPGGVVGYVTCSPHRAETLDVVEWALGSLAVDLLDAPAVLPQVPDAATGPDDRCLQLWPHRHGTDAMFLALLRRSD
ncbi:RsmB/NOP family class I SAM-dependent RNA methyltransferase [Acidipropionibacterium timonense]|uniref:RsmB/NOP family class I SAM-dependent RNA methyltransferase n=1 Tax=Acidipropionibacterium timonense TaxID=2161818 RepID=UPI00102FBD32|nr:RsmB/NOP family class I SAM-dependent RNA methyltransferase [Acidipropionibacterium timonense]